jgi:nucleoside-diphosphate-sugar epimerase
MKILITGGAGFIGSHLVASHLNKDDEVFVVDNLITGQEANIQEFKTNTKFHFLQKNVIHYDFSDIPEVDVVYHMASPASPIQYKKYPVETLQVNSTGTNNVLEFIRQHSPKARFLLASTSEIYGDPLQHPQTEEYWGNVNTLGPRSCYDEAKRFGEALANTYLTKFNIDIRIARIFNTYGPKMEKNDGRVISNFVVQALTKQPITIYGDGKQTRSFCYVSDLVKGLQTLATKDGLKGKVTNIGNPDERTITELAQLVKEMTKTSSEIVYKPIDADDPKKRKPDITKAKDLLEWQPTVTITEGLEKTIEYFKKVV